ncbi:lysogenization regulator HflD [Endozoicomonas sp. (ex Bugula neritina AB1)]|nr:lysogenization regulator HflD [Endozoicomonas sp. (ex Bugula neritina AB1)]
MQHTTKEQAAALAGLFQAASLVDKLAKTGQLTEEELRPSISSIFVTSPRTVEEVFGSYHDLATGRKVLSAVLNRDSEIIQSDVIRYALGLIHLEKKLGRDKAMLGSLSQRLERAGDQVEHFSLLHDNVISSLGSIYLDTISTFRTRIQVTGDTRYLQSATNANKIRAILLAGIRSAMLWRQCGGSRWQLFMGRKKLLNGLNRL